MLQKPNFGEAKIHNKLGILDLRLSYSENGQTKEFQSDPNGFIIAIVTGSMPLSPCNGAICEITGEKAVVFQASDMCCALSPDIFERLIHTNLKPEEWKILHQKFPSAHLLHDDFYSGTGRAIQPK